MMNCIPITDVLFFIIPALTCNSNHSCNQITSNSLLPVRRSDYCLNGDVVCCTWCQELDCSTSFVRIFYNQSFSNVGTTDTDIVSQIARQHFITFPSNNQFICMNACRTHVVRRRRTCVINSLNQKVMQVKDSLLFSTVFLNNCCSLLLFSTTTVLFSVVLNNNSSQQFSTVVLTEADDLFGRLRFTQV